MRLKKAKNETQLIIEQNKIKKYSTCLAVYDLPKGVEAITFGKVINFKTGKRVYKLYLFTSNI